MSSTITVQGLTKAFGSRTLWRDVEFSCPQGSITALTGPSGSGKSTLLNYMGTLDTADSGTIMAAGKNIQQLSSGKRRAFRKNNLGFLFQDYALIPDKSVEYNIDLATVNKRQKARVDSALETVGLSGYRKRVVHELSGASSSAWPWPAYWPASRRSSWPMSPPARSILATGKTWWISCALWPIRAPRW